MSETPQQYKIHLDVYNGPLDLLLYLIQRDEIDIYDIPIAEVTQEYLKYVEVIERLDVDFASEFVVMATKLMEIKSRMLLPRTDPFDEEEGEQEDPRMSLIQELLEYKRFRERAAELEERAREAGKLIPRRVRRFMGADGVELELEEIGLWQLMDAFQGVLEATMHNAPRVIVYDDTPLERVIEDLEWRIAGAGNLRFYDVLEGRDRGVIISYFLAVLELAKQNKIRILQEVDGGEIYLTHRGDAAPSTDTPAAPVPSVDTEPTAPDNGHGEPPADEEPATDA